MTTPDQIPTSNPYTVRGWLDRAGKNGKPEHIDLTPDEVANAEARFGYADIVNIFVELSDGTKMRPYRFCGPPDGITTTTNEDGDIHVSI
jgi:hypothetical protein